MDPFFSHLGPRTDRSGAGAARIGGQPRVVKVRSEHNEPALRPSALVSGQLTLCCGQTTDTRFWRLTTDYQSLTTHLEGPLRLAGHDEGLVAHLVDGHECRLHELLARADAGDECRHLWGIDINMTLCSAHPGPLLGQVHLGAHVTRPVALSGIVGAVRCS